MIQLRTRGIRGRKHKHMNQKQIAGEKAAEYIKDGMIVGTDDGARVIETK